MSYRSLNSTLQTSLLNGDAYGFAHLIKFEKPIPSTELTYAQKATPSRKAINYAYLTDGPYDIKFNDGTSDSSGNPNGEQNYLANKVLKVGSASETIQAKATGMSIKLPAEAIGISIAGTFSFNSTEITAPSGTDWVSQGFQEGDTVKFEGNGTNADQVVRINSFTTSNTKIKYTLLNKDDGSISSITTQSATYTAKYHSAEINALTTLKSDPSFSSYLNREVFIYRAHINPSTGVIIGAPFLLFKGIITGGKLKEDPLKGSNITWNLTSHWGDFVQVKGRTTSDASHRGINTGGVSDEEAVFRPEYASDLGFFYGDQAVNVAATYQVFEEKVRVEQSGGFFKGDLFSIDNTYIDKVPVDRDVDLAFNLKSRYLPVVYGVQKVGAIPFFADGDKNDAKTVYIASALCEGPIHSIMDIHVDDEPIICANSADFAERAGVDSEARVVCVGRADKGDVLLGNNSRVSASLKTQQQDILDSITSYENEIEDPYSNEQEIQQARYHLGEALEDLGAVNDAIANIVGESGVTHEKRFTFESPMLTDFTFHAGRSDQIADAKFVTVAGQGNFKLQSMYHTDKPNSLYWGPNHKVLDTAYIAQKFTINAEEFTVPKTSYVIKGKVLDCFNYDRSYFGSPAAGSSTTHADFMLGDYVKIFANNAARLNSGSNTDETVQIIDKFSFYTEEGELQYRYRFSKNLHLQEDNDNLTEDQTRFFMQHLTSSGKRWYFSAHKAVIDKADSSGLLEDISLPTQQVFKNTSHSGISFTSATQSITVKNGVSETVNVKRMTGFPTNNAELAFGKTLSFSFIFDSSTAGGYRDFTIPYTNYNASDGSLEFYLEHQNHAKTIANFLDHTNQAISEGVSGAKWMIAVSDVIKLAGSLSSTDNVYVRSNLIIKETTSGGSVKTSKNLISDYDASEALVRVNTNSSYTFNNFPTTEILGKASHSYTFSIEGSTDIDTSAFNVPDGKGTDRRVSINPAIQLLDYLTNDRYGKGLDIDEDIDKESFLAAARFCDSRSDVTMVVKTSTLTTTPTDGAVYKYPSSGSPILFQGTVKGTPVTYDVTGTGDSSRTNFTQIVFTDVIGQLGRKWNDYRTYEANRHVIYHNGSAFSAASTGTMNATARDAAISSRLLTGVGLTKVSGTGDSTVTINVEKKFGFAGNGNPVVRQYTGVVGNFEAMGYSLYDADDCTYWKYLGWEEPEQRNVTRHQTNIIINTSEPVFSNVNILLSQFNGMLRYGNGKYSLAVKQKAPVDAHFNTFSGKVINQEDIIGSIDIDDGTSKKKLNQISANIIDPSLRFGGRGVTFTNSDYIKQDRGIKKEGNLSATGITNYFNARIAVKQLLDESRFGITARFTIDSSGYLLQAGDIIRINYSRFGWTNKEYRIESLNFSPNGNVQVVAKEHNNAAYTAEYIDDLKNSINLEGGSQGGISFTAPGAPTNGDVTTDQAGRVKLTWTNGTDFVPTVQATQVARHPTNVTPNAAGDNVTIIADTQQDNYIDSAPGDFSAGDITHYYWVRHTYSRNHGHTASVDRNKSTAWLALGEGTAKQTTVVEVEGGVTVQEGGLTFKDNPSGNPALKGGQSGYDNGTGFFLGHDTDAYKLSIGNSSGNKLTFDGTNLAVTGAITASSLTISDGASVTGSIPNTNIAGLGTASTQDTDDFATGAEGDLATSASQVNVGLAFIPNKQLTNATNDTSTLINGDGEALICGVDKNGNPAPGTDGFIQWKGNKITVERIQYTDGYTNGLSILTQQANRKGFIIFDTAKGNDFTVNGTAMDFAFAWKVGTQWYYDKNSESEATEFTPTNDYVALGYMETSTSDLIVSGGLFGHPIPLEQAAFPGDVVESGTIGGIKIDNEKIYAGAGNFFTDDTGFYLKNDGDFSLSNKLKFDESEDTLTVDGNITASSLTISSGATVTGSIPNTNISGLGTASVQDTDDFATGAEGDLATSAAQPADIRDLTFASKIGWNFESDKQSWTTTGTTAYTHDSEGYVVIDSSGTNPIFLSPTGLALNGKLSTKVRASIRRTSGSGWQGTLFYQTNNGHSFQSENKDVISTDPTGGTSGTDWIIVEWDMANQSHGSSWTGSNTINQIRLDFGNSAADTFEVNWVAIGETGANALQEGADIQDGSAGGWTIEPDAIYTGTTKVTSGYNDNNQVTLNKDGGIHAKKFYIDASDGSAHFKGVIEGGSIKGENANAIPTDIFTRSSSRTAPTGDETGGFIDLVNGNFVFGNQNKFIAFGPDADNNKILGLRGDIIADRLFANTSIETPLLKVGAIESNTIGVSQLREEVFAEIDTRLGNAGGYYDSYETGVSNTDDGYLGTQSDTYVKELKGVANGGYEHSGETTFLNFTLNDAFSAPRSAQQAGRSSSDLQITVTIQKAEASATPNYNVDIASKTMTLTETVLPHSSSFIVSDSLSASITAGTGGHVSGTSYFYRVKITAATSLSMFRAYDNNDSTSGANDSSGSPILFEVREGSIGSGAGNLDTNQYITHTGDNDTNIEFGTDQIKLNAGGETMITLTEAASDTITLHKDTTVSTNLTVTGDLTVSGTTTTLNTTNLDVKDKNILLASGSANKAAADGAGITVDLGTNDPVTPDASLTYAQATNDWLMNKNLRIVTDASTGTFQVGRDANNQYIQLHVTDGNNTLTAKQDSDNNGNHSFILDRVFAGTGNNDFHIRKGGADQLVINTDGHVGIGISDPHSLLHVDGGDLKISSDSATSGKGDGKPAIFFSESTADEVIAQISYHGDDETGDDNFIGIGCAGGNATTQALMKEIHQMVIKAGGKVGIGTSDPTSTLHVKAATADLNIQSNDGNSATLTFGDATDTNRGGIEYASTDDLIFKNNNLQTRMTIRYTGDVGIGTSDPDFKLQIKTPAIPANSTYQWPLDLTRANNETRGLSFGIASAGTTTAIAGHNADVGIGHTYGTDTNGLPEYYETLTVKDVDQTVGRVGIGHTNPLTPLHIHSFTNTSGSTTGTSFVTLQNDVGTSASTGADLNQQKTFIDFIFSDDNSNETPQVRIGAEVGENANADSATKEGSGAFVVYTNDSDSTSGASSPAERFRVDYQGNVGIGTTDPAALLHVSSGTSGDATVIIESDTDNNDENDNPQLMFKQDGGIIIAKAGLTGDAGQIFGNSLGNAAYFGNDDAGAVQFYTNATARLTILSDGKVGIGTKAPNERLTVDLPVSLDSRYHSRAYTAGSFYLGNHDWYNFCVMSNGTKEYDATNQGMKITGYGHVRVPVRMPIDPKGTYRIKVRVKQISLTSGSPSFYCGVDTLNENLTTLSSDGATSYNYGVATNISLTAGTTYTFENYFTGYNAATASSHTAFDPEGKYFDVIILTNHGGNGVTCIQSLEVEKVSDTDALKRTKTISNQTETVLDFFDANNYRSARFTVQVEHTIAGTAKYQTSEILVLHDGSDAYLTEYGMIETGGILATFDAGIDGDSQVRLKATVVDDFSHGSTEDAKFTVIQHRVSV